MFSKEVIKMDELNITSTTDSEKATLDFWAMKNMSTCEYESTMGNSAWSEWDKITDSRDDDDD